ncbi:MAG: MBOAT family protein [Opitutaceae bacterium]|nr:MBOAT family protein [Opitutaceae bacterium]
MLFNSAIFLFAFLPGLFALYLAWPSRRNLLLLAASLAFYAWAEPVFIFWALGSALLDYFLGHAIVRSTSERVRRGCVAIGAIANLGLLGWFKYAGFTLGAVSSLAGWLGADSSRFPVLRIALPIAVSFIVFEKITYLVDLYRGNGRPAPNLRSYLLYVFLFPKLLAGPIIRYCDIESQLTQRAVVFSDVREGLVRFLYGLGKKVLLADHVAKLADAVFALPAGRLDASAAWLGMLAFSLQIYFDFSGYSDMAIGLCRMLGFRLRENFRMPYLAENFTDFWRRWHISLSTWIREYLYLPLGGNRGSTARTYGNLCLCFVLSGLWHGAAWTFLAWGVFHGIMLTADRAFWLRWQQRLPRLARIALTFLLVSLSWVVFRAADFASAGRLLVALVTPWRPAQPAVVWCSPDVTAALTIGLVLIFAPLLSPWPEFVERYRRWSWRPEFELAACLVLLCCVLGKIATDSFHAFLYFRF